jgi:hypothetical protein
VIWLDCFDGVPFVLLLAQVLLLDLLLIAAIVNPDLLLAIPRKDVWKFQIFAALTLDFIWLSRNKLIFEGLTLDFIWLSRNKLIFEGLKLDPVKASKTITSSLELHLSAWSGFVLPSLWSAPHSGVVKGNFDVAIREDFAVTVAVVSDSTSNIISAATQKLFFTDVDMGEVAAACGVTSFVLEGNAFLIVLAINSHFIFSS